MDAHWFMDLGYDYQVFLQNTTKSDDMGQTAWIGGRIELDNIFVEVKYT